MRHHEATKAYVARRTAEGKSKRDIIRCLKRYVIREVYQLIKTNPQTSEIASWQSCEHQCDPLRPAQSRRRVEEARKRDLTSG